VSVNIRYFAPKPCCNIAPKKLAKNVFDERAIDAFAFGLRCSDFVEELRRIKPRTVSELMKVANRFADEEDNYHNKRTRSPEHDRSNNRHNNQRRRSSNEDNRIPRNQVAVGYKRSDGEGDERKSSEYRSKYFDPSAEDILHGPCRIHYAY
jgi:hypothetical protein